MENQMFPTLYKLDTKSRLREWTIHVDMDKYWTVAGLIDGKKVTNDPIYAKPMNVGRANETNSTQQAISEASHKYQSKIDEGYNVNIELAKEGKMVSEYFKPMLAHKFEDRESKVEFPLYSQPKLDGIRCLITYEDGKIIPRTRNGKPLECIPHIVDAVGPFFEKYPYLVLDGELYNHDFRDNFNKITSLVRKQKPVRRPSDTDKSFQKKLDKFEDSLKESSKVIQYWIYDIPEIGILRSSNNFVDRYLTFVEDYSEFSDSSLVMTPLHKCNDMETLNYYYHDYESEGYEGQMAREDAPYENKRSKHLLKRKNFEDSEYLVTKIIEGEGNWAGRAKSAICKTESGQTFRTNIKGSYEELSKMLINKSDYEGLMATIKYQDLTPDGIPRFPYLMSFRDYE